MKPKQNKTFMLRQKGLNRQWHLYDLKDKVLGRAAVDIAKLLMGKHKPNYTPHLDNGDYVVVINAESLAVTGNKLAAKKYYRHSNYPGGFKEETLKEKLAKDPAKVVELAVKGMLPKNKLQKPRLRRLKVYPQANHPHQNHFNTKSKEVKNHAD